MTFSAFRDKQKRSALLPVHLEFSRHLPILFIVYRLRFMFTPSIEARFLITREEEKISYQKENKSRHRN